VQAGGRAYAARGCVNCHGAPGASWQKFSEGLRPDPPDLSEVGQQREPGQLFWVIKNGIKMTGMPAWSDHSDAELWATVAFVRKLPAMSEQEYARLVMAHGAQHLHGTDEGWPAPTPSDGHPHH